jgi:hypothetical protein
VLPWHVGPPALTALLLGGTQPRERALVIGLIATKWLAITLNGATIRGQDHGADRDATLGLRMNLVVAHQKPHHNQDTGNP